MNDAKSITEVRRAQGLKVTIAQQMFNSYGAMNEILDFFEPLDVLKFQILSRWMYVRGVCRCQMTFRLLSKTFYYTSKTKFDKNKIYCYETRHERLHTLENPSFNFAGCVTLMVGDHLYSYSFLTSDLKRYSDLLLPEPIIETLQSPSQKHQRCALANIDDNAIILTGGVVNGLVQKMC